MKTKAIVDIDCRGTAPSQSLTTLTAFPFVVPAAGTLFGVHWVDDVLFRFLLQGHCGDLLEGLLHVQVALRGGLKVVDALGLCPAPRLGFVVANESLGLRFVHFVAQHNEGEIFWVSRHGLDQELFSPTIQLLERLHIADVVHEHTRIGATVECHAQTLESFLSCSVPNLHSNELVINHDFLGQEIGTNGSFVLICKFL